MASTEFGTFGDDVTIYGYGTRHTCYSGISAPDSDTVGYWRIGNNKSLTDVSGNGHTLTARNGAEYDGTGLEAVSASSKYADTGADISLVGLTSFTLECWAQYTGALGASKQSPVSWYLASSNRIFAWFYDNAGTKTCQILVRFGGTGATQTVILTTAEWAAIEAAPSHMEIDVLINGVASSVVFWLNGKTLTNGSSWTLSLGAAALGAGTLYVGDGTVGAYVWDGPVDEVRLSSVRRNTAAFDPVRNVAVEGKIVQPAAIIIASGKKLRVKGMGAWKGMGTYGITNNGVLHTSPYMKLEA